MKRKAKWLMHIFLYLVCYYAAGRVVEILVFYRLIDPDSVAGVMLGVIFSPIFWIKMQLYNAGISG